MYPNQELSARKRVIDDSDDRPALSARARKSPLAPEFINSYYSIGSLKITIHLTFSALAPHDHDHDHAPRYAHAHTIIQDGALEHLEERVSGVARTRTQIHDDRYCERRRGPKDEPREGRKRGRRAWRREPDVFCQHRTDFHTYARSMFHLSS